MANAVRGQVSLKAGDTTYTICLSTNAVCELEDLTGEAIGSLAAKMNGGSVRMTDVRALVWAALQDHHPDADLKEAGNIITLAGMPATMEAVGKAFELAFPEVENDGSRPPKAKAE